MLLVDKPTGMTSARAVAAIKRALPKKTKVGHTGTLDPLASGLLALMVGRATRLSRYIGELEKTYVATARFGAVSDSLDADGEITGLDGEPPGKSEITSRLPAFTGEISQTPPMASAVKVGGRRLYELHRAGQTVEREARTVTVHEFALSSYDRVSGAAEFFVRCGGGTYVRSLVADLARSAGSGAYLTALRRESVGGFEVRDAVRTEDISGPRTVIEHLLPMSSVVGGLPAVAVDEDAVSRVSNGRSLGTFGLDGPVAVMDGQDLVAVYVDDGEVARPEVVLCARQ